MQRLLIAAAIVVVVVGVALIVRRRRRPDAPTQGRGTVPVQLDRDDFARPEAAWLVVVFTSATCHTCADVVAKAGVLATDDVAVDVLEFPDARRVHERYHIDAVPTLVVADGEGVVRASVLGPVSATDLWALVASARSTAGEV